MSQMTDPRSPLHHAIIADDLETARQLLTAGADPNLSPYPLAPYYSDIENDHPYPLILAIKYRRREMVDLLLQFGARIDLVPAIKDEEEFSLYYPAYLPFHYAILEWPAMALQLFAGYRGAATHLLLQLDFEGTTSLEYAATLEDETLLCHFLTLTESLVTPDLLNRCLCRAVGDISLACVEVLLARGADPLYGDCLRTACEGGILPIVKRLLAQVPDPITALTRDNYGALVMACVRNREELIRYFCEELLLPAVVMRRCFFFTVRSSLNNMPERLPLLRYLLEKDCESLYTGAHGVPALHYLMGKDCFQPLLPVLEPYLPTINWEAVDFEGATVFHHAAGRGAIANLRYLHHHTRTSHIADNHGRTPLTMACINCQPIVIRYLLRCGAIYPHNQEHGQESIERWQPLLEEIINRYQAFQRRHFWFNAQGWSLLREWAPDMVPALETIFMIYTLRHSTLSMLCPEMINWIGYWLVRSSDPGAVLADGGD